MNTWHRNDGTGRLRAGRRLAIITSMGLVALAAQSALAGWAEGSKLPDLKSFGLEGAIPALGGKVVVIDFWASWCGPCKVSFPLLEKTFLKYKADGVVFLAVNVDEEAADMKKFLESHPVSFVVVHDAKQRLVESAAVEGMPTSFVVDRTGVIRAVHKGFHPGKTEVKLASEIESLLKVSKGVK